MDTTSQSGEVALQNERSHTTIEIFPIPSSAARFGTALANHVEVLSLTKSADEKCDGKQRISGAKCRDVLTGEEFHVKAKTVINATGPFTGK